LTRPHSFGTLQVTFTIVIQRSIGYLNETDEKKKSKTKKIHYSLPMRSGHLCFNKIDQMNLEKELFEFLY